MSRVERKNQEKLQKKEKTGKIEKLGKLIGILAVLYMLFMGVIIVDEASRAMMMTEEPKVFDYRGLDENMHELTLCGMKVFIDEKELQNAYEQAKTELKTTYQLISNKVSGIIQIVETKVSERINN